jgi:hypothetical protein
MKLAVFFSWQSDTKPLIGRNFIERALSQAIGRLQQDLSIEQAVREEIEIDKDTKGVAGTPPIFDTILKKIDSAAVFLADLTFVGSRLDGSPSPNPNVLIEYGWALKSVGYNRIITVMNSAYGEPSKETMPFDMAHLRFPYTFWLTEDADAEARRIARDSLSKYFEQALRGILSDTAFIDFFKSQAPKPKEFVARQPVDGLARFRASGFPLGFERNQLALLVGSKQRTAITLANGAAAWLRVMPVFDPGKTWLNRDLESVMGSLVTMPLTEIAGSAAFLESDDGCGFFFQNRTGWAPAVCFVFQSGEIWAVAAQYASLADYFVLDEAGFCQSLLRSVQYLQKLGISGPFRWIVGFEGVLNRQLMLKEGSDRPLGVCMANVIELTGEFNEDDNPEAALRPFFDKVFDRCGVRRRSS